MTEDELKAIEADLEAFEKTILNADLDLSYEMQLWVTPLEVHALIAEVRRLRVGYDELTQKHDHLVEKYSKLSVDYSQARHALDVVSGLSLGQDLP